MADGGSKRHGMRQWLCMHMGRLIKNVEGKRACLRTNRSVSHQDLCEFAYNLPSALSLRGKRHQLEWVEFSCVTLNNGCGCMCVYAGNQYAGVICVFSSISVNSAVLIHSEKFIDIHIHANPSLLLTTFFCFPLCRPPRSQAFQFVCGNRSRPRTFICMKMR